MRNAALKQIFGLLITIPSLSISAMPNNIVTEVIAVRDSLSNAHQSSVGLERDRLAFQLGRWFVDSLVVPSSDEPEAIALVYWAKLKTHRYREVAEWLVGHPGIDVHEGRLNNPIARHIYYSYQFLREDFSFLEKLAAVEKAGTADAADHIALGQIAFRRFQYDDALQHFSAARSLTPSPILQGESILLASAVLYREDKFQESRDTLCYALHNGGFSDDLLYYLATVLIRLGEVREATALFKLTIDVNPCHESAHYFLGNGYSSLNYSQLAAAYSLCFPQISKDDKWLNSPDSNQIRPLVVMAEQAWIAGDLAQSELLCNQALARCPDYGRAHAMLAKVYESIEYREKSYFQGDNREFEAAIFPEVPQIEAYVLNWNDLSARHRKRVAMSVAPWRNFIPVLVATGQTHYIKPIREKLSECPHLEVLADQRVDLDSRLWDDVRGCGGYNTVTGVEDVERTIFRKYNTVLHELTHQVHGILTESEKERIETTFRAAKEREETGIKTFISQYQASNEWEYFAEGVNAYFSPRRDENDNREIVMERLLSMDTALVELVEHFTAVEDVTPYFAVGVANRAYQMLEEAKPDEALEILLHVPETDKENLSILNAFSHVYSILDSDTAAVAAARRAVELYPDDASVHSSLAVALRHSTSDINLPIKVLENAIQIATLRNRRRIAEELGWLYREAGRYTEASAMFDTVLSYQSDSPAGMWGLASCWRDRLFENVVEKDSIFQKAQACYDEVVPRRSGNVALRLDYAGLFLLAGHLEEAAVQIDQAANIRPDDPAVWCFQAWLALLRNEREAACELLDRAVNVAAVPDLTYVLRACVAGVRAKDALKQQIESSIPHWEYDPRVSEYVSLGRFPTWQRRLMGILGD